MTRPRTRASNTLDFLQFVEEEIRPGVKTHLRVSLSPEVATALLDALPTDWHDVEDTHGPYVTELVRLLGAEAATAAWRRYSIERLDARPAYRALMRGAVRLFGLSLGSFIQLMPKVWAQGFKDCFEVRTRVEGRAGHVTFELAPAFARFEAYTALLHGVLLAYSDYAHASGSTLEYKPDFPARRIIAVYRW
jgi:hypothetical protein